MFHPATVQAHLMNLTRGFESNPHKIFKLTTSMDVTGFSMNLQQQQPKEVSSSANMWKGFSPKPQANNNSNKNSNNHPAGLSSSKTINESSDFYHQEFNKPNFALGISESTSGENLMFGAHEASAWQENRLIVDDSTLTCVFPCEGNKRPSQGLSLSRCSSNSSPIGLQSFELRHTSINNPQNQQEEMRFMDSSSRDGGFFGKSPASMPHHQIQILHHHRQFQLRSCKYLGAGQELLNELCGLGTKQMDAPKPRPHKSRQWEDQSESESESASGAGSSSMKQSLCSLEFMELQMRESKLLSMLDEVKRRYKYYRAQMKALVSSFDAVAGDGSASVYSALASKTISRHFRCLKDGIVGQIHATKKAMEEKDPVARGTSEGEAPQLRITDKSRRRQRAFQIMSTMESHPWRPQRGLPERSVSVLRAWLFEHFLHPYPSEADKHILARNTGLSRSQVSNWFINARVRLWKPMVEEMYMEETKDLDIINRASSDGDFDDSIGWPNQNPSSADQKPTPDQLAQIDSECLSSIISDPDKNDSNKMVASKAFQSHHLHHDHQGFGALGSEELDFSSYNHHAPGGVSYANHDQCGASNRNFDGSGSGVSLTLGLQQNEVSGVSLAFSPASQSSLFFA